MKAGRLRHRIRIYTVTNSVDTLGAPTKTWTQVAEVNADVTSVSGRELFGASRDLGDKTWRITLREIPGVHVDGTYKVTDVDTGAIFDVTAVLESHAREMLTLVARSGSSHP